MVKGHVTRITLLALAAGVAGVGCQVAKPRVTVTKVDLASIDFQRATLDLVAHVENSNPFPIRASSVSYDIDLGQSSLVHGTVEKGLDVPAAGASDVTFPLTFDYGSVLSGVAQAFATGTVHYKLSADVGFSARLAAVEVPVSTEGDLPLPRPPIVMPTSVRAAPVGLGGVSLEIGLDVTNPNAFGCSIDSMTSSFSIAGVSLADSQLGPLALAANGTAQTSLTITLPPDGLLALARALATAGSGASVPYKWVGRMVIDGLSIGTQASGQLPAPSLPALPRPL